MKVVVTGLNHATAPVHVREKVAIAPGQVPRALMALRAVPGVHEAAILSTCNRTEVYAAVGPEVAPGALGHFLLAFHDLPPGVLDQECVYTHLDSAAAAHICAVAAGLDSAILGETQVLAQTKGAYNSAAEHGTLGPYLHQLFNLAIATAKQVQTRTAIGQNSLSMGSAAIQVIRREFASLDQLQVLVLGTGKMGRLALRHLVEAGVGSIVVISRSPDRACELVAGTGARCARFDELTEILALSQVVITATTGLALEATDLKQAALRSNTHRVLIDLGVPRNITPEVGGLRGVHLFNVDDLKLLTEANLDSRRQWLQTALEIVKKASDRYGDWLASRAVVPLISSLTEEAERIRTQELERVAARMERSGQSWSMVEQLTRSLTGRLLHECKITLKRSAAGR